MSSIFYVMILRTNEGLKFIVFSQATNKEDYNHFYSAHSSRMKTGDYNSILFKSI